MTSDVLSQRVTEDHIIHLARQAAFLHAHLPDRGDGQQMLDLSLTRLYDALTVHDDGDEPDLTFCCGCRELIDLEAGQEQWVLEGAKYHDDCYQTQTKTPRPDRSQERGAVYQKTYYLSDGFG